MMQYRLYRPTFLYELFAAATDRGVPLDVVRAIRAGRLSWAFISSLYPPVAA